jgi:hypothetical protein
MTKYHRTYCKKSISPAQTRTFIKNNLYYYYVENTNADTIWVFENENDENVGFRFYLNFGTYSFGNHLFKEYFIPERKAKLLKIYNKIKI